MNTTSTAAFLDELGLIKRAEIVRPIAKGAKSLVGAGAGAAKKLWGAAQVGAGEAAKHLETGGTFGRAAGSLVRLAPAAGVAYGGYKAYESNPVQNLRAKWQMHKLQKAQEEAMQGGY